MFCAHAGKLLEAIPPTTTVLSWLPSAAGGAAVYLKGLLEKIPYAQEPPNIYKRMQHLGFDHVLLGVSTI